MSVERHRKLLKLKACRWCRKLFTPHNSLQAVCSPSCAIVYAREVESKKAKRAAIVAKRERRVKLQALKTISQLIKEAQVEFNKFIRERDFGNPCISCGRSTDAKRNAGHYLSTGAFPELRFNEDNCFSQCEHCNSWKSGNIAEYRPRLIAKIGAARVEVLESNHPPHKWVRDELIEIRKTYVVKWKSLKAERENGA